MLGLLLLFQNCGAFHEGIKSRGASSKTVADEIQALYIQIESVNENNLSCEADTDCEAVAIGHKICGGPSRFVVVSLKNPLLGQLTALAGELEAKERAFHQNSSEMVGDCMMVVAPPTRCQTTRCSADVGLSALEAE